MFMGDTKKYKALVTDVYLKGRLSDGMSLDG